MEMVMDNLTRYAASVATKERSRKQILRKKKLGARAALVRSLRCVICHAPTKIDIEKTGIYKENVLLNQTYLFVLRFFYFIMLLNHVRFVLQKQNT